MSTTIPRGAIAQMFTVSGSLNPGSVAAGTSAEQNVPVTGVKVGDFVIAEKPSLDAGLVVGSCRVSADGNIKVNLANCTGVTGGSAINAGDEVWRFLIFRPTKTTLNSAVIP